MVKKKEIEKSSKIRADQYSHHTDCNECHPHFKENEELVDRTIMIEQISKWIEQHFY